MELQPSALYANLLKDLRHEFTFSEYRGYHESGIRYFDGCERSLRPRKVAALALSKSFLKKFQDDADGEAESRALLEFLERNSECEKWTLQLETDRDKELYGTLRKVLDDFFHPDGLPLISSDLPCLAKGRVGPGASAGTHAKSFFDKLFSGPLTVSRIDLYDSYKQYISRFPDWCLAEETRKATYGGPIVLDDSILSFAPKDRTKARVICTEKTLDMFFQLGLGRVVEERLISFFGIDLSVQQERNRELARLGSLLDFSYSLATVDLKCASDMPLSMAKSVYPKSVFDLLYRYRSRSTFISGLGSHSLSILSSMGNGYTFPMQTVLFASIVRACFIINGVTQLYPRKGRLGNFGVFGDDIICPSQLLPDLYRLLSLLGLVVNVDKSFAKGPFRESCGADYYNGRNVRGIYTETIKTPQSRFALCNALNEWSAKTQIYLPRTIQYVLKSLPYLPIPWWDSEDAGLRVPSSFLDERRDWRGRVQYKAYRPKAYGWTITDAGSFEGPKHLLSRLIQNPHGLWLSFMQGSVRAGKVSVRQTDTKYSLKKSYVFGWDYRPSGWLPDGTCDVRPWESNPQASWERWNTALHMNFKIQM